MLTFTDRGIYCPRGDFYIDPWKPVHHAVITHAHSDHARPGMSQYLAHRWSAHIMRHRLGAEIRVQEVEYGEVTVRHGVKISLHPAGHILGSAQVRVEYKGEVWVVSGDYKLHHDGISTPYEPVRCHHFITESTFGLPVFRWPDPQVVHAEINAWWKKNADQGKHAVIFAYALGKAQRVLSHLDRSIGPVLVHGAVHQTNHIFEGLGLDVGNNVYVDPMKGKVNASGAIIIAPPSAMGTPWLKRFGKHETAMASGWMMMRGTRRRRNADRGFVLSDHADWTELNQAVEESRASHVYVTHGYTDIYAKYLRSIGKEAVVVKTDFSADGADLEGE
jgi:putative mRNA 3-end processing factor